MPEPTYGLQHINKLCCWCNQHKTLSAFYRHPMTRDGLCPQCKVCQTDMKHAKIARELTYAA